jgi:cell fate regulator YaaT (PSP1 superfamily)
MTDAPEVLLDYDRFNPLPHEAGKSLAVVTFLKLRKQYYFDYSACPDLKIGDRVIVQTQLLGDQMGEVRGFVERTKAQQERKTVHQFLRRATPADLLLAQQWQEREVPILIECREKAAQLNLYQDVKFVAAEYNYNGTLLLIFFSPREDESVRLNTQPIKNALQGKTEARIEFRQVSPREVAKLQGGLGACGIPRCCSTFLTDFSPISLAMAKAQGISLNPSEITGMCGRLRCCLTYEYQQYVEARKQLPKIRKRVGTPHGEGRVIEIHPLRDGVTVQVDEERYFVSREDLQPLAEYEALKAAAASPCSKNKEGGCDCGAKRPRGDAQELLAELGIDAQDDLDSAEDEAEAENILDVTTRPQESAHLGASGTGKKPRRRPRNRRKRDKPR